MKLKKAGSAALLAVLMLVLVMLVGSRRAELGTVSAPDGLSVQISSGAVKPDNDTNIIAQTPVTPSPQATPEPEIDKPDIDITSWEYVLVNQDNSIYSYSPDVELIGESSQYFDRRAMDALEAFLQGARDAGFTPYVNAAYRPYSAQQYIFNGKASQIEWGGQYTYAEAVELAKKIVAFPGTSEHQLGLCCDIMDKYYSKYDVSLMDADLLAWLKDNCAQYGFILRYPSNKVSVTGWDEPWHFRYVGLEAAGFIMENGITLEEFWKLYQ